MPDKLNLLLAGRMSAPRADQIRAALTTDWDIATWSEDEPFERFAALVPQADALVGGRIRGDWPAVPKLKLYQIPFTGHDWIGPAHVPKGCIVCNTYEHEIAIAEYVLCAMLEWEIGMGEEDRNFRTHGFDRQTPGTGPSHGELYGKTLGIVGYGHIGREVAVRAHAFGMRCIAVTRTVRPAEPPLDRLDGMDALDPLLGESDYVLIALPLADETHGLFDAARLAQMKPDGVLINVGRGAIVEEETLYRTLKERRIGGAIIDVWYGYPSVENLDQPPSRFPFQELDNIVMTPHNSARSAAMRRRRWSFVARNLDNLACGAPLENICFEGTA